MNPSAALAELVSYLDDFLRIAEVPDDPNALNGLQVENRGTVDRIVAAVDASQITLDGLAAETMGSALLLVHHGLFWDGQRSLTGRRYRRLRTLLDLDCALYAAHLPLDLHPIVGNNILLAREIGLEVRGWFGEYKGVPVGVWGRPQDSERSALLRRVRGILEGLGSEPRLIAGGPERVESVGIITGGAGSMIGAAKDAGLDTFITGEGAHHTYFDAMEAKINVVYAGHYATERLGVQALAAHLSSRFDLPFSFHEHPTGL